MNKVSEAYRNLQSRQFVAEETAELAAVGESRSSSGTAFSNFHRSVETQIELAAVVPGKVLLSDGRTAWAYMPKQKQYSEASWAPTLTPWRCVLWFREKEVRLMKDD